MKKGKKEIEDQLKDLIILDENEMKEAWDNYEDYKNDYPQPELNKVWDKVTENIEEQKQVRTVSLSKKILRYAAVIIPLIILGTGIFYTIQKLNNKVNFITYNAPSGVRSKINLSDGSTIWLQPNSQIKYPKSFTHENREIYFNGQGYFKIAKNPEKPFIVHTQDVDVTVLGTQFYLKAKLSDNHVETGLITGKVKVSGKNSNKVLNPDDIVTYSRLDHEFLALKNISSNTYQWENGSIVFDNCNFNTVLKDISDWYNLDLEVSPQLNINSNITLTIREESVFEIMEILKKIVPIEYDIDKNKVEIYSRN